MTDPAPLSTPEQAVLDAAIGVAESPDAEAIAAAALRAATGQLCLRWSELSHPADVLNNIADELDPQ